MLQRIRQEYNGGAEVPGVDVPGSPGKQAPEPEVPTPKPNPGPDIRPNDEPKPGIDQPDIPDSPTRFPKTPNQVP